MNNTTVYRVIGYANNTSVYRVIGYANNTTVYVVIGHANNTTVYWVGGHPYTVVQHSSLSSQMLSAEFQRVNFTEIRKNYGFSFGGPRQNFGVIDSKWSLVKPWYMYTVYGTSCMNV